MSLENLSEVLWSTAGGPGIVSLLGNNNNDMNTTMAHLYANSFGDGPPDSSGQQPHNFLFGISIAVATSFIQSLGLTIQRKSHIINEAIHPKELRRQACQRPLWHLGFHTYILSNLTGTIFSIGYLPVIILAPLGAVTLVFNALFARLLLGDVFSRQSAIGKKKIIVHEAWSPNRFILHFFSLSSFDVVQQDRTSRTNTHRNTKKHTETQDGDKYSTLESDLKISGFLRWTQMMCSPGDKRRERERERGT